MKFNTDLRLPLRRSAGYYRTERSCMLCVVALTITALPAASAFKIGTVDSLHSLRAAPAAAPAAAPVAAVEVPDTPTLLKGGVEVDNSVALTGSGGGLKRLEAENESHETDVYRPWKTRFDLQPFNFDNPKFLTEPENRMSYRHFYAANPRVAEAPNTRDRNAQSDAVLVFGLTALAAVISGVVIITKLEVLRADELNLVTYQQKMLQVIAMAAVPWLALGAYVLTIFVSFVGNPMRYSRGTYHWQCNAMVWFIFLAPGVNLLYFISHAIWISRICFSVEQQAPMGRMFNLGIMPQDHPGHDAMTRFTNMFSHSVARQMLFFLEVVLAITGYVLITFRWGANSQFCSPEVYWTTTALCVTVCIVIVFTSLAFICSICLRACSISPWMQDFAESFWRADLEAKIARNEAKEERMTAKAQAKLANDEYEAQFKQWLQYHEEQEEERRRHDEFMKEHAEYQFATSQPPPQRMLRDREAISEQAVGAEYVAPSGAEADQISESERSGSEEYVPFETTALGSQPAFNMAGPNPFAVSMPYGQPSTMGPLPPGAVPSTSFISMQPGTLPPGTYGVIGTPGRPIPMTPPSPASLPGAPSGSLPPGSLAFRSTPGRSPEAFRGTLPPSTFQYLGGPGLPTVRSTYSESDSHSEVSTEPPAGAGRQV